MDPPLEVEGCLVVKAEQDPGWAPEPVPGGAGSSRSETFRRRFRRFCYEDVRGPREAFGQLWELGCRWLKPETRSKEQILELLVVEQFLSVLPAKIRARAQQQCPQSGEEAVALVIHLEEEAGRRRAQVCSPVQSEKQAPHGAVWDVADFPPETPPRVVSREEAGSLHSGHQEQLTPKREQRPFPKNARPSPWVPIPDEEWNTIDQEVTTTKLPAGSQGPVKDVHLTRGFSYKKSVHQIPAHGDLYQNIREESVGNMVSLDTPDCKWAADTCIKVNLVKFVSVLRRQKVLPAIQQDSLHGILWQQESESQTQAACHGGVSIGPEAKRDKL